MGVKHNLALNTALLFTILNQNSLAARSEYAFFARDNNENFLDTGHVYFKNHKDTVKVFKKQLAKESTIESQNDFTTNKDWGQMEFAEQRYPDAIIIGAKKCGTRALLEFLRLNPRIRAPGPEVHFFDKHFDKGFDWYRKQMPFTAHTQIVLEKSPSYFIGKHVPERIYSLNPKMKLILVVRNPIMRAISDFTQTHLHKPMLNTQSFDEFVTCNWSKDTMDVVYFHKQCVGNVNASVGPIRIGIYHKHLHNWMKYFPLRQIFIVNGENLIENPAKELRAVEKFLGLEPVITPEHFMFDAVKGFQCIRKSNGEPHCLPKSKGRPHVPVSNKTLEKLQKFYESENEKFFVLINQRFNWL